MKENIFKIEDNVLIHCIVNLPHVEVPEGVTTIKKYAFSEPDNNLSGQKGLRSVTIPKSVTVIEECAFYSCEYLETAVILGPATIGYDAFFGCDRLYDVYLADGVQSLESKCFSYCENLKTLFIPASVESIGYAIACQNDSSCKYPVFHCERKGKGKDWDNDWNLIYHDSRFGSDRSHSSFHFVYYGMHRSGFTREAMEWLRPKKPATIPEPPKNAEDISSRIEQAKQMMKENRGDSIFDLLYIPGMPSDRKHKQVLEQFYSDKINRLRDDQIERIRTDSQSESNVTACFLYGYWLLWNANHFDQMKEMERLLTIAANAGYNDIWWLLKYIWSYGQNSEARIDNEKAEAFKQKAIASNSETGFIFGVVNPLLYGWDGETNPQKALDLVNRRIEAEGGVDNITNALLVLRGNCYYELGDKKAADDDALLAIERGGGNKAWKLLILTRCSDGDKWDDSLAESLIESAAKEGSQYGMYFHAMSLKKYAKVWSGTRAQLMTLKARILLEKAALLGDCDACQQLAFDANSGDSGFYGYPEEAYPYFLHGAMAGDATCAYWLYKLQEIALDNSIDCSKREFNLPALADHNSPAIWRSYAMSLHQADEIPWPDDNQEKTADKTEEAEETNETETCTGTDFLIQQIKKEHDWSAYIKSSCLKLQQSGVIADNEFYIDSCLKVYYGTGRLRPTNHLFDIHQGNFVDELAKKLKEEEKNGKFEKPDNVTLRIKPLIFLSNKDDCSTRTIWLKPFTYVQNSDQNIHWPKSWDYLYIAVDWLDSEGKMDNADVSFSLPGSNIDDEYTPVSEGMEVSFEDTHQNQIWGDLFEPLTIISFDNTELTVSYGKNRYTLIPGDKFMLDKKSKDSVTYELNVTLYEHYQI